MRKLAAVLLTLLLATALSAEVRKDTRGGVSYDVPSWWNTEQREQGIVTATPDGTLMLMVWTPRTNNIQEAVSELEDELEKVIQNAKPEKNPTSGNLNGMETLSISGRGRMQRTRVEYSVIILGAKKPVIVLAIGETGKYEKHNDALAGFLKSIKRLK